MTDEYVPPSIGRVGEPFFDQDNNRIKLLSTKLFNDLGEIVEEMIPLLEMKEEEKATRITARFFYSGEGSEEIIFSHIQNLWRERIWGVQSPGVEAVLEMMNGFTGMRTLYLGHNNRSRLSPTDVIMQEEELLRTVLNYERGTLRPLISDFFIAELTPSSIREGDVERLVNIYSDAFRTYTVDLDESSVKEMIENTTVYVARNPEGEIVSVGAAELAEIPIDISDKNIIISELSEISTHKDYQNLGLGTNITNALIESLNGGVSLLYAEARACHGAINTLFRNLGFRYGGRINKHCKLSGRERDSDVHEEPPYENLNVWFYSNGGV